MLMTVVKSEDVMLLSSHLEQHYRKESRISFKNKKLFAEEKVVGSCGGTQPQGMTATSGPFDFPL